MHICASYPQGYSRFQISIYYHAQCQREMKLEAFVSISLCTFIENSLRDPTQIRELSPHVG